MYVKYELIKTNAKTNYSTLPGVAAICLQCQNLHQNNSTHLLAYVYQPLQCEVISAPAKGISGQNNWRK
jgi:hypothetical protein